MNATVGYFMTLLRKLLSVCKRVIRGFLHGKVSRPMTLRTTILTKIVDEATTTKSMDSIRKIKRWRPSPFYKKMQSDDPKTSFSIEQDALIVETPDAVLITNIHSGYTHRIMRGDLGLESDHSIQLRRLQEALDTRVEAELTKDLEIDDFLAGESRFDPED